MKKIFFLYFVLLLFFTVFSYGFIDPNLIYLKNIYSGFAIENKVLTTLFFVFFIFAFYFLYCNFLFAKNKLTLLSLKWLIGLTVFFLIFAYPAMLSYDIFNYLTTAKVSFFYHENPYLVMPIEFSSEPFLAFTRAANKIALYGPFWEILSGIPYFAGFGNFLITIFSFKIFTAIFYLGTIFLIFKLSKNILSVVFFALNPLVIIETLVSSHNDIVMIFFALLSFWFLMKKKILSAFFFLFLSVLIKYATIFLLPVFIYVIWKRYIEKQNIDMEKIFYASFFLMGLIFIFSFVREEIYPWYAIWILAFTALVVQRKFIFYLSIVISFSFLMSYTPFLYSNTYLGLTPLSRSIISFTPPILFSAGYVIKKKV